MKKIFVIIATIIFGFIFQNVQAQRIKLPNGQTPFISGMNVAWNTFGGDAADTPVDLTYWGNLLDNVKNAGGNSIRWWVFVNASQAPKFDGNGYVSSLGSQTINNVQKILDLAQSKNMMVMLCLFSFDLLQTNQGGVNGGYNQKMVNTDAGITACINKCIVPLVTAIGKHPAILCWEIFNEPEGMTNEFGWSSMRVNMSDIQKFVNRSAGAIHRAVSGIAVSNGSWNMKVLSPVLGQNYYSNTALKNVGGDADGYLDFYMDHYYDGDGSNKAGSPYDNNASHWGLDKPVIIAEFATSGADGYSPAQCYQKIYDNNYAGALGWAITDANYGGLTDGALGMKYIASNHPKDIVITFSPLNVEVGPNQVVYDANLDGSEVVTLDGSGSSSTSGTLTYAWKEGTKTLASTVKPNVTLAVGKHIIYLTVNDGVNAGVTDSVTITIKTPSLSYKKPVTVTSTEVGVNVGANAVDGDSLTRWASLVADPQSITVDLQATYNITSVVLSWELASAKDYTVQISLDGITFVAPALVTKTGMAAGARIDNLTGLNAAARFVRINGTARTSTYGYSLFEFEVWGNNSITPTSISLNKTTNTLQNGAIDQLSATILPTNASNKSVNWTSSNSAIASVDASGLITAKAIGTTTITATTVDGGLTDKCSVTVNGSYIITASSGGNGSISPSGAITVSPNGSQVFNMTPNANFKISQLFIDGVAIANANSYLFSNVSANHTIAVSFKSLLNNDPIAAFTYAANAYGTVTFDASTSSDPDGDPLTYSWTFGDGSNALACSVNQHTYAKSGTYSVTLTVSDGKGGIANITQQITITLKQILCDVNANDKTKSLMMFLNEIYGKNILSGQVNQSWLPLIQKKTGDQPAILGLDFDGICPSQGGNNSADVAIDWVKNKGGIVAYQWHWISPDANGDYYGKPAAFDLAGALNNPTGQSYKNMLRDIDLVATQIKKMQDAGVPIIWRPLHESEGGWFWWGMAGKDNLIKLYRLMYDRFTNYHQLHNIIWLWNSYGGAKKGNWYPGDDVCDLIAWDYENSDGLDSWALYQSNFGTKGKLWALAEVGKMPDPANFAARPWLFFNCWDYMIQDPTEPNVDPYGRVGQNNTAWTQTVYADARTINLSGLQKRNIYNRFGVNAGADQFVLDTITAGSASVTLDGTASSLNNGCVTYVWKESNTIIANGISPTVNLADGLHTIVLYGSDSTGYSMTDTVIVSVKQTSLSYHKPVTASSESDAAHAAKYAVDANISTRWSSLYTDPQTFTIDLLSKYTITAVVLNWETASAKDYTIQVSNDGTAWTTISTKAGMATGARIDTIKGLSANARYIKMVGTARTGTWGYSLYEFEVWGKVAGTNHIPVAAFTSKASGITSNVQIDVKNLLNARPLITYTGGKVVPMNGGIDAGSYSAEATLEAANQLKNVSPIALPNDGKFAATTRHPEVILNFSNADGTNPQARRTTVNDKFTYTVPSAKYTVMEFFAMSSGVSPVTATLNYADGTTDSRNINVPDWYNYPGAPAETATFFNLALNLDKWDQNNNRSEQYNHYLFGFDLQPNTGKTLNSVTLDVISGGCFTFWGATGVSADLSTPTITFDGSQSFDADFDALSYSWDFGDGNTGTGVTTTHTYTKGGYYTVVLTVNDGNGDISTISQKITVYPLEQFAINASAGPGGSITPKGTVSVTQQNDQSFTIQPAANYSILDVLVDSISVGAVTNYTFTNVTKAHSISASFVPGINANLALDKPVTVTSTEAGLGHIASNITDGDATTRWSSLYTDPQWFYVDLLDVYSLSSIIVNWEVANAKTYSIDFSVDGKTWTNAIAKTGMATGLRIDTIPGISLNARYVRITGTARNNATYGYSVFELEVYGSKPLASQTLQLQAGWNLISFNVLPSDKTIETVFGSILTNVSEIKTADAFWLQGQNTTFNSLKTINDGSAYLVKMKTAGTITVNGLYSTSVIGSFKSGWQMVGCPYQTAKTLQTALDLTKIDAIKNFDTFWNTSGLGALQNIEPGKGYFVRGK